MTLPDELRHAAAAARDPEDVCRDGSLGRLFDRAADRIQELEKMRWIPFAEQGPPPNESVLVFGGTYRYHVIAHAPSVLNPWTHREGIDPTHWCPLLPDPEDSEDGGNKVVEVSP